jgi:hypothetical protein
MDIVSCPRHWGAFRTFLICLIDAADCSILSVMRCLKNWILELKVVVSYSNGRKEPGSTLHEQTMLTDHLHMETGEARRGEVPSKANFNLIFLFGTI